VMLANGTPDAFLQVYRGLYRLRLLNGSNARILKLAFSDNRPFHLIASDGGLLDKPVELTQLTLGPAERAEILMNFAAYEPAGTVTLKTLAFEDPNGGMQGIEMPIIRFDVLLDSGAPPTIPSSLSQLERLDPSKAVAERTFEFRSDFGSPAMHTINSRMFDMERVDEQMRPGDIEIWTFLNRSQMPHPVHAHGAHFQVIDVNGNSTLAPEYLGWKDTVLAQPYEPVRVVVRIAEHLGVFLLHCHNLEHEDHGMMMNFEVTNTVGVQQDRGTPPGRMDLR
jgi:blue copper oxidase